MNRVPIAEHHPDNRHRSALWATGFRPFYLGGALFACAAMLVWLALLDGYALPHFAPGLPGVLWHAHEMIFGFGGAIVSGFLLTAVRAWSERNPAHGGMLAATWLLWLAGRVALAYAPPVAAAVIDIAFLPVVAGLLLRVLVGQKNSHNIFLPAALALLAVLNLLFHVWALNGHADWALRTAYGAVGMFVLFVTIIGGRIIPSYTLEAIPGLEIQSRRFVERAVMPLTMLAFALDAFAVSPLVIAATAIAAAVVHGLRLLSWHSWRVGNRPILAILHIAYAWIPAGCLLLAAAALGFIPHSIAIHAFTVGAMGCAIIAMITRTARVHTRRPLVAGYMEIACYGLLVIAALIRTLVPWLAPQLTTHAINLSGACWIVAFVFYCIRFAGWLATPRIDGKAA